MVTVASAMSSDQAGSITASVELQVLVGIGRRSEHGIAE